MKLSRPQYGLQQQIVQAIYALRQKKSSELFREPVDINKVPDYYDIIKKPMDLTTILTKLKAGEYQRSEEVYQDLELIIANCLKYNRAEHIIKKAEQFKVCIGTVWTNFKREVEKKGISYNQKIDINQQLLKRIAIIQQKRTKKKIPALQVVIQQEKKNILPQSNILPPIEDNQRGDREELPPGCEFIPEKYATMDRDERKNLQNPVLDIELIIQEFEKVADKKLTKYRKILKKRLLWFDQKIIQKCMARKMFQKMQIPKHLNSFIQKGSIAEDLNIRKLQMYVKKITYWVEDNSSILSDYMKDRFVENCRIMKKCILRVIKYKKTQRNKDLSFDIKNLVKNDIDIEINNENQKQEDNYENKMKEFKRMLDKDRQKSTKRDTKIILRNQNGTMQVYDWTSDKKQQRGIRKQGGGGTRIQQADNDERKKQEQRKKEQLRKDEQFIEDYSKKSNVLLIAKYGNKLAIDWQEVKARNTQFSTQFQQIQLSWDENESK